MDKPLLDTQIVDELLARLHKAGMFQTDGVSDESVNQVRENLKCGVRLVLEENGVIA